MKRRALNFSLTLGWSDFLRATLSVYVLSYPILIGLGAILIVVGSFGWLFMKGTDLYQLAFATVASLFFLSLPILITQVCFWGAKKILGQNKSLFLTFILIALIWQLFVMQISFFSDWFDIATTFGFGSGIILTWNVKPSRQFR